MQTDTCTTVYAHPVLLFEMPGVHICTSVYTLKPAMLLAMYIAMGLFSPDHGFVSELPWACWQVLLSPTFLTLPMSLFSPLLPFPSSSAIHLNF